MVNKDKEDKYGDDAKFESWADNNIFFPLSTIILDPLYHLGFTPNMITIISTLFTIYSIYLLDNNNNNLAAVSYFIGYMLDCVDGRMARKYSMFSDIGMALDCVSDNISNFILFSYLIINRESKHINIIIFIILGIFTYMLSISYGINEAMLSYKDTGDDNFYLRRVKQLCNKQSTGLTKLLYNIFLFITKISYESYKYICPEYNVDNNEKWLKILKLFGTGNYCLFVTFILLYIK